MREVRLLNPNSSDAKVASEIVASLRKQVQDADRRLATQRMNSYDAYIGAYEAAAALRKACNDAENTFGKHFKI